MPKKKSLSNELKGLGTDLSKALRDMIKSTEFRSLEKEVSSGFKAIAKSLNNVDECFAARPEGVNQMIQTSVAVLEKDPAILFGLRLALNHLVHSD